MTRNFRSVSTLVLATALLFWLLFVLFPSTRKAPYTASSKSNTPPVPAVQGEAQWLGRGTTIPVGVWSEWISVGIGCSVDFSFAPDTHRVVYTYYSNQEYEYKAGTSPNVDKLRYMILKDGITKAPYTVTCP